MRKSGQDRWRDRLLSFDAEIAITGEPAARARLHHAAGRLLEERLERHREALARYRSRIYFSRDTFWSSWEMIQLAGKDKGEFSYWWLLPLRMQRCGVQEEGCRSPLVMKTPADALAQ